MPSAMTTNTSATGKPDIVVVGAGIVGSALAYSLGKSGRKVALLERDFDEPDRIVGELLQPGGVRALSKMGIVDTLEDIDAVPVEGYHVFYGSRSVPIPYPNEKSEDVGKGVVSKSGKVEGRSFHHGKFVQSLRNKALYQSNVTPYEATVRDLIKDRDGKVVGVSATWKKAPEGGSEAFELLAPLTIVADGCFSKFRRTHGSSIQPMVRSNFVGLELEDAPLPAPHHGHVVLSKCGPVLLYQIGTHSTRILIDVAGEKLLSVAKGELQKHINEIVIPQLPEQLRECIRKEMEKGQRLRSMPNSFLPPSMQGQSEHVKGVIVVGDAMNMRHPLTGGGMTVGLWDAVHLTEALGGAEWGPLSGDKPGRKPMDLSNWPNLSPALKSWHWNRKALASVINILAQALYSLFGADDENLEVLREGCFKYFEMGGECVNGPVSLLSGLAPQPMLLVGHFFAVALYSIWALFVHPRYYEKQNRTRTPSLLEYPGLVWRSIMVFYTACVVLLPVVFTEMKPNVPRLNPKASGAGNVASRANKGSSHRGFVTDNFGLVSALILLIGTVMLWGQTRDPATARNLSNWLVFPKVAAQPS
ncbi:related to squalene monooxygenase [Melanopsichium pennsylvanicum]|uniref:Squalene monooxygenase n=2 Tax=Melanopsichium pennsylvanicum TaxID=63383 RepID=A0AAJ4XGM3_9BASI|nr:related to squalene monooxygenase [Melanopsichium pennsylvanicum 4]SNX82039.1 related to squalene monooxygenase [Melanopsichium pennsylvanicum]